MKVLINTLGFKHEAVVAGVKKIGADKQIVIYGQSHGKIHEKVQSAITEIKREIPETNIISQFIAVDHYEISSTTRQLQDIIRQEYAFGNTIYVNASGGRKTLAYSTQFACYLEHDKVTKLFYLTQEENKYIELPILKWYLSNSKRSILWFFQTGVEDVKEIAGKLGITTRMIYRNITELLQEGYLVKAGRGYELTQTGEILADDMLGKRNVALVVAEIVEEQDWGDGVFLTDLMNALEIRLQQGVSGVDFMMPLEEVQVRHMVIGAVSMDYIVPVGASKWRINLTSDQLEELKRDRDGKEVN